MARHPWLEGATDQHSPSLIRLVEAVTPEPMAVHLQCGWCGQVHVHRCADLAKYVKEGYVKFEGGVTG